MPYRPLQGYPGTGLQGIVYLIHLDQPLGHARHYRGWSVNLEARLRHHRDGTGANLLRVARDRGISWRVAATEPGDKFREQQLKNMGGATRHCPICREEAANVREKEAGQEDSQLDGRIPLDI